MGVSKFIRGNLFNRPFFDVDPQSAYTEKSVGAFYFAPKDAPMPLMPFMPFKQFGESPFSAGDGDMSAAVRNLTLFASNGIAYLLRDTFSTPLAAGSVNGTLADTGQARTVVDSTSVLSITGGKATFASSAISSGDPGLWYPSQARVAGKMLIGVMNIIAGSEGDIGFDSNQAGNLNNGFRLVQNTVQVIITDAVKASGAITPTTDYTLYHIMRDSSVGGFFFLIKGGTEYPRVTLLFVSTINTAAGFPGVTGYALGVNTAFSADDVRIPLAFYIPPPLAYDTFTRANAALGFTEILSPDSVAITALVWNFTTGKWAIVSNVAVGTPTQGADLVVNGAFSADTDWTKGAGWTISAGTANASAASANLTATVAPLANGVWYQTVYTLSAFAAGTVRIRVGGTNMPTHAANATYTETNRAGGTSLVFVGVAFTGSLDNVTTKALTLADLFASVAVSTADVIADVSVTLESATSGKQAGLVLNLDSTSSPANFILVYLDGQGNVQVDECVAGTYTAKQTTAITYSAGAVLRAIRSGTDLRVFYNNVVIGTLQTMTANTNANHGLFSTSPLSSLDNFTLWARGTGGEYEGLSVY